MKWNGAGNPPRTGTSGSLLHRLHFQADACRRGCSPPRTSNGHRLGSGGVGSMDHARNKIRACSTSWGVGLAVNRANLCYCLRSTLPASKSYRGQGTPSKATRLGLFQRSQARFGRRIEWPRRADAVTNHRPPAPYPSFPGKPLSRAPYDGYFTAKISPWFDFKGVGGGLVPPNPARALNRLKTRNSEVAPWRL